MRRKRKARGKREERIALDEATIRPHVEPPAEGGYVATSPDVPGLVAEGRSITKAVEIAQGPQNELEPMMATVELLTNKEETAALLAGLKDFQAGRTKPLSKIKASLGKKK